MGSKDLPLCPCFFIGTWFGRSVLTICMAWHWGLDSSLCLFGLTLDIIKNIGTWGPNLVKLTSVFWPSSLLPMSLVCRAVSRSIASFSKRLRSNIGCLCMYQSF
eukprot:Lithocolla_globosa_v1_NODE_3326_length_1698_cov_8.685332.p4 type:complete len:104 gc:universal NODE_3326_length_1698_cov_8.685332:1452-1141(-)